MRKQTSLVLVALALGMMIMPGKAAAAEPDATADGPIGIGACKAIARSGSYILVKNLTATDNCLVITASFVTIDLNGFSITSSNQGQGLRISANPQLFGIAVRNGSISGFEQAVDLHQDIGSDIEGLRTQGAITADGIVRDNLVSGGLFGIIATVLVADNDMAGASFVGGVVRGNLAGGTSHQFAMTVAANSTVIGNNVSNLYAGLSINCPSNVIGNVAVNNVVNIAVKKVRPAEDSCSYVNNLGY